MPRPNPPELSNDPLEPRDFRLAIQLLRALNSNIVAGIGRLDTLNEHLRTNPPTPGGPDLLGSLGSILAGLSPNPPH